MSCRYCTCADCSFTDTGAVRHPIGEASPEEANTIPRDLHELYKEAAEAWAKEQVHGVHVRGREYHSMKVFVCCGETAGRNVHVPDCKAARILGLKRE